MKIFLKFIIVIIAASFFNSCDFYPDWTKYVEYSDVYPICGEYMVRDFKINDDLQNDDPNEDWYILYIYNKSYNPTKDSIWIDNATGHAGVSSYNEKFKIKCKADTVNLSFDIVSAGHISANATNPADTCVKVTISNSKIWDLSDGISDPTPDSIYFEFTYFDKNGNDMGTFITLGHRKTGWEFPNYDDDM